MKNVILLTCFTMIMTTSCTEKGATVPDEPTTGASTAVTITDADIAETVRLLKEHTPESDNQRAEKGVKQTAALWTSNDGSVDEFKRFCINNFVVDTADQLFAEYKKLERNFEILFGRFHEIDVGLTEPLHLCMGKTGFVDSIMGAYSAASHLTDDMFDNKIAFFVTLNFPAYTLAEKNAAANTWTRRNWAYARMGDLFVARVPANIMQAANTAMTNAEAYIADYNIHMGNIVDSNGHSLFPTDMVLITHWNLRDELKANYHVANGLQKQRLIYDIMLRIIRQEIPQEVINGKAYRWNPTTNTLYDDSVERPFTPEPLTRYAHILKCFKALAAMDKYCPIYPTFVERAYDESMEISQKDVEAMLIEILSSPQATAVGQLMKSRLGRNLEPFDIWYDGFAAQPDIDEEALTAKTRHRYPTVKAFEHDIERMLQQLGWKKDKANYIADKIVVDAAKGAGHAWGAERRGDVAHLRTRMQPNGMDYKGYNIACHELGHNVEQTITLYDIDHYMLHGVPNTAFTEAVAFLFQHHNLELLGEHVSHDKNADDLNTLDMFLNTFEIAGVALVDMYLWQWMYENPDCNLEELKNQTVSIAIDVWNKYYYPVFGVKDSPILAIYSHIVTAPLYLANYPVGHIIEYQIADHLADKPFADELTRMLLQGRITPQAWMRGAVNADISGQKLLNDTKAAVKRVR